MEVLLAGNTGYVTETFIEESFPECDVVVLGIVCCRDFSYSNGW